MWNTLWTEVRELVWLASVIGSLSVASLVLASVAVALSEPSMRQFLF